MMDPLLRTLIRDLVIDAIKSANTLAGHRVVSPQDWPTMQNQLPAVLVAAPGDSKQPWSRGPMQFTTVVHLELVARLEANGQMSLQEGLDLLGTQIEHAIFTYAPLLAAIQQFPLVESTVHYSADGTQHLGEIQIKLDIESAEGFDPTQCAPERIDPRTGIVTPPAVVPLNEVTVSAGFEGREQALVIDDSNLQS